MLNTYEVEFVWTDGLDKDFEKFYRITEEYYNQSAGGIQNRTGFAPYNIITNIDDVLITYKNKVAIGYAGFKKYSKTEVEKNASGFVLNIAAIIWQAKC